MLKAYKYRLYPTPSQTKLLEKHFGCVRLVFNKALALKKESYERNKVKEHDSESKTLSNLSCYDIKKLLPVWKQELEFLKEVNSLSIQQSILNLDIAYKKFFKKKGGYPKFKSRKDNYQSFTIPQNTVPDFENQKVRIPKFLSGIKSILHRTFTGTVKSSTISRTPTGKYFISILVDTTQISISSDLNSNNDTTNRVFVSNSNALAFDLGIKTFLVASNGDEIDNPKFLRRSLRKLRRIQIRHSRKVKGSSNRDKHRRKYLSRIHEKVTNQRNDFLHKTSKYYVYDTPYIKFIFENLNVKGMVKNHKLAQSINDASWSKFKSYIDYKSKWNNKEVISIGRFQPSSKQCIICKNINTELTLKDRIFICPNPVCNHQEDRDLHAAKNILQFAIAEQLQK